MDAGLSKNRKKNPRENAFPLSAATFFYTIPTFIKGFKRDLVEADLPEPLTQHKSNLLGEKMEKAWQEEEIAAQKARRKCSLRRVLFRVFKWEFLFLGLVLMIAEGSRLSQPIFLGKLIKYFRVKTNFTIPANGTILDTMKIHDQNQTKDIAQPYFVGGLLSYYNQPEPENDIEDAYWYAAAVIFCSLLHVLILHPFNLGVYHLGMKMRVGCCSLIYRKSLRLSKTALGQTTVGQVVNLLSNDVNRFDLSVIFAHHLWVGPLETIVVTYLMSQEVQISAVVGVLFLLLFIPIQIYLGKRISVVRLKTAIRTDERVRLMNEIISGIQVIKMYAWEKPFAALVGLARGNEIKSLKSASFLRGITLSFIMFNTRIALFASILSYLLLGNEITAEKVFVLTSFYNILRQTMTVFFPQGVSLVAEANVSINRLNQFLLYNETGVPDNRKNENLYMNGDSDKKGRKISMNGISTIKITDPGVFLKNVTCKWSENLNDNTLTNISLSATPGRLLAVIGPVGGGKTSLLHAILKELPLLEGSLKINGEISYASQEPWLFASSVRQNILFGLPMDKLRYKTVVKTCALERDFHLLPYGDKTLVGDRGVALSGGQRARINLARAIYKQSDIYLLDDPLSAVDTHVGKELFQNCITSHLRNKTVILITHQLQYLKELDHIIVLDDGVIKAEGTFRQLQGSGLDFTTLLRSNVEDETEKKEEIQRQNSIRSFQSVQSVQDAPIEEEEQMLQGSIGGYVYKAYLRAGGNWCLIFTMFGLCLVTQLLTSFSDYFLTLWVNLEQQTNLNNTHFADEQIDSTSPIAEEQNDDGSWDFSRNTAIYIYSTTVVLLIVITLVRSFTFFIMCMKASTRLHSNLFTSITMATMRFFNTNSSGRILNRFSKDMGAVDEALPAALIDCLQIGLAFLGVIVVVAVVSPWLMIPTVLMGGIFYLLRKFYVSTSRNIKRLEGVTRSPVFSHMNATLQGLTSIRAFKAQTILIREFDNHQDLHSSAWYTFISTSRAFGYWLDLVCILYLVCVTFSFLIIGTEKFGGNVGLAITQALGITGMLQWGIRQSAELENQMTSVERILEYNTIEHEGPLESPGEKKPPTEWPSMGKIEFRNVFLRYFPQDPPVLKNLNMTILPNEKVGIVGRTGAGKSSLINAIFRLTDMTGDIIIDGIKTSSIGLHELRSKISIIPQEPVLFSGTMRKNLDPFDEYSDVDLWRALEDVEMKEAVSDLASGLNSQMSEGGTNFSVGQRQLVCLARAILRNNKVLVLDEATANVDPQTDALIQTTIRRKFAECTVLTIAHRLHTVMDSDKVLVMDAGTLKEFDHPYKLLQNPEGILHGMVLQTGKAMTSALFKVSENAYNKNVTK